MTGSTPLAKAIEELSKEGYFDAFKSPQSKYAREYASRLPSDRFVKLATMPVEER